MLVIYRRNFLQGRPKPFPGHRTVIKTGYNRLAKLINSADIAKFLGIHLIFHLFFINFAAS